MKSRHETDGGCLPPITTLLQEVLTHEEMTSYLEVSQSVKPLIEWYVTTSIYVYMYMYTEFPIKTKL